jgi:hypothetical protein
VVLGKQHVAQQVFARWKVPVQRAGSHLGFPRNFVKRGVHAGRSKVLRRNRKNAVAVAPRISPQNAFFVHRSFHQAEVLWSR